MCCTPQKTVSGVLKGLDNFPLQRDVHLRVGMLYPNNVACRDPEKGWLCVLAADPRCCNTRAACLLGQSGHWRVDGGFCAASLSLLRGGFLADAREGVGYSEKGGNPVARVPDRNLFWIPWGPTAGAM